MAVLVAMKLAEALALRADAARRAEELRARIAASAAIRRARRPPRTPLLSAEASEVLGELEV